MQQYVSQGHVVNKMILENCDTTESKSKSTNTISWIANGLHGKQIVATDSFLQNNLNNIYIPNYSLIKEDP